MISTKSFLIVLSFTVFADSSHDKKWSPCGKMMGIKKTKHASATGDDNSKFSKEESVYKVVNKESTDQSELQLNLLPSNYKENNEKKPGVEKHSLISSGLLNLVKPAPKEKRKKPNEISSQEIPKFCAEVSTTNVVSTDLTTSSTMDNLKSEQLQLTRHTTIINPQQLDKILNKVNEKTKLIKEIIKKYELLFRGLGCDHGKCFITTNQRPDEIENTPSKITVDLKNDLNQEMDYMDNLGVIEKTVTPTSWVVYLPPQKNKAKEVNKIANQIIHGEADEKVLSFLRSEKSDVHIAKAPTEQVMVSEIPFDDSVDAMYEMESFYRDISFNDHLTWIRPKPTVFLKHRTTTKKPVKKTKKKSRKSRKLKLSRIRIPTYSATSEKTLPKRNFLFFHAPEIVEDTSEYADI